MRWEGGKRKEGRKIEWRREEWIDRKWEGGKERERRSEENKLDFYQKTRSYQ